MHVKFWGTFASTPKLVSSEDLKQNIRIALDGAADVPLDDPSALEHYIMQLPQHVRSTIGGNTSCIELSSGDQRLIVDAGSGVRLLGLDWMASGFGASGIDGNILVTDTKWDHVQGFPFFVPAFIPGNHFTFHSAFEDMALRLDRQQEEPFFPVDTEYMQANFAFNLLVEGIWHQIGEYRICVKQLAGSSSSYAYRIEDEDSCIVLASNGQAKYLEHEEVKQLITFLHEADLVILDTQYRYSELSDHGKWHQNGVSLAVDLAIQANAKRLIFYHHHYLSSDEEILTARDHAARYLSNQPSRNQKCQVMVSQDGLSLEL